MTTLFDLFSLSTYFRAVRILLTTSELNFYWNWIGNVSQHAPLPSPTISPPKSNDKNLNKCFLPSAYPLFPRLPPDPIIYTALTPKQVYIISKATLHETPHKVKILSVIIYLAAVSIQMLLVCTYTILLNFIAINYTRFI